MAIIPLGIGAALAAMAGGYLSGSAKEKQRRQLESDESMRRIVEGEIKSGNVEAFDTKEIADAVKRLYGEDAASMRQAAMANRQAKDMAIKQAQQLMSGNQRPRAQAPAGPGAGPQPRGPQALPPELAPGDHPAPASLAGSPPDVAAAPPTGSTPIDTSRPILNNPDGSFSTERTITVEMDGRHYNIPTIVNGQQVTPDQAVQLFRAGKNPAVGVFGSAQEANAAAQARSQQIGQVRGLQPGQPPAAQNAGVAHRAAVQTLLQAEPGRQAGMSLTPVPGVTVSLPAGTGAEQAGAIVAEGRARGYPSSVIHDALLQAGHFDAAGKMEKELDSESTANVLAHAATMAKNPARPTADEFRQATVQLLLQRQQQGLPPMFLSDDMKKIVTPGPEAEAKAAISLLQQDVNSGVPFRTAYMRMLQSNLKPDPAALDAFVTAHREQLRTLIKTGQPGLSPEQVSQSIANIMGEQFLTEAERTSMKAEETLPEDIRRPFLEAGEPVPRKGSPPGASSTHPEGSAKQAAKPLTQDAARVARKRMLEDPAIIAANKQKLEQQEVDPGSRIPESTIKNYINPDTLDSPNPAMTQRELDAGVKRGQFVPIRGTPAAIADLKRSEFYARVHAAAYKELEPILKRGALANFVPFMTQTSGLAPEKFKEAARERFGLKPEQAEAAVRIQIMQDLALSVLRTEFDERGQGMRGDVIKQGKNAMFSLSDDAKTAQQKVAFFNQIVQDRREAVLGSAGRVGRKAPALDDQTLQDALGLTGNDVGRAKTLLQQMGYDLKGQAR